MTIPAVTPFTMQSFALFLALFTLGGVKSALCVTLYLTLGGLGLPLFSGMSGGLAALFGPTGGFLFGFGAAALLYALLFKLTPPFRGRAPIFAGAGMLTYYLCGAAWFSAIYHGGSFADALLLCVAPYVLPDLLKLALAFLVSKRLIQSGT